MRIREGVIMLISIALIHSYNTFSIEPSDHHDDAVVARVLVHGWSE